jgi:hypothetical protein
MLDQPSSAPSEARAVVAVREAAAAKAKRPKSQKT